MENIKAFLDAVEQYGLAREDTFVTVDLFEGRNMKQVSNYNHISAVSPNRNCTGKSRMKSDKLNTECRPSPFFLMAFCFRLFELFMQLDGR